MRIISSDKTMARHVLNFMSVDLSCLVRIWRNLKLWFAVWITVFGLTIKFHISTSNRMNDLSKMAGISSVNRLLMRNGPLCSWFAFPLPWNTVANLPFDALFELFKNHLTCNEFSNSNQSNFRIKIVRTWVFRFVGIVFILSTISFRPKWSFSLK